MATTAEGRRRRKNRSKQTRKEAGAATTVHDLPAHIFESVLLRLGPSPWLVRAAAVCRHWCRVVADVGFLARLRSAHPHATRVGDYHWDEYNASFGAEVKRPVFVPSSPASAIDGRHFALDFLPGGYRGLLDTRGALLLLVRTTYRGNTSSSYFDLLVCDPLTRRHQGVNWPSSLEFFLHVFLVDGCDTDRRISVSNFRLLAVVDEKLICVFSSGSDGGWRLVRTTATGSGVLPPFGYKEIVGRANGSIYWGIKDRAAVRALDMFTMEFSIIELPENIWGLFDEEECAARIIGGNDDGAPRIVRLTGNELKVFAPRHGYLGRWCRNDHEWVLEKQLGLPDATVGLPGRKDNFFQQGSRIIAANTQYILLSPILTNRHQTWLFSVELETMRVERNMYNGEAYPFELPWPPVLPDCLSRGRRQ